MSFLGGHCKQQAEQPLFNRTCYCMLPLLLARWWWACTQPRHAQAEEQHRAPPLTHPSPGNVVHLPKCPHASDRGQCVSRLVNRGCSGVSGMLASAPRRPRGVSTFSITPQN